MKEVDINAPIDESKEDWDFYYISPRDPKRDMILFLLVIIAIAVLIYYL